MKNTNIITAMLATATIAALPAVAAADHRSQLRTTLLGEVGTHANDIEDFVPVSPARRYDSIVVTARGGMVPLTGVKIQYADGRIVQPFQRGLVLKAGQSVVVDVPDDEPIKMLVLDYDEHKSSRWGDRATARVEVVGQRIPRIRYQGVRYDNVPITRVEPRDELRFNWRGGVFVRIN